MELCNSHAMSKTRINLKLKWLLKDLTEETKNPQFQIL